MNIFKEQIRWKLLLLLSLLLLGLSVILTTQHVLSYKAMLVEGFDEQKRLLKDNMLLRAKNQTDSLAAQLENELAAYNFSKFTELIGSDASRNHNISRISVLDKNGAPLIYSLPAMPGTRLETHDLNTTGISVAEILYRGDSVLVLKKNLFLGTQPWGILVIYFSQSEVEEKVAAYADLLDAKITRSLYTSLASMGLFFLLFFPVVYSMALHISNPIVSLTRRAEALSEGHFENRGAAPINRQDELGTLERTFTKMSENLHASYQKLADYNAHLERMVQARTHELEEKNVELEKLSITDRLTHLCNRVRLEEVFSEQLHVAQRYGTPFALLLCDIDFFKRINDSFGHIVGDKVLVEIAQILEATIRETDLIGRWGGEEFLVICRETDREGAMLLAERLREAVEKHAFATGERQTLSIGVSCYAPQDTEVSMLGRADRALYLAKNDGRNRVVYIPNE